MVFITKEYSGYFDTIETSEVKFPLFYSELLTQLDPGNNQIYDWDVLSNRYKERTRELGLFQKISDSPLIKEL